MLARISSIYHPARGGRAPDFIRDAFLETVDAFEAWGEDEPEPTVEYRGQFLPISRVFGVVWNCTDILPGATARQIVDMLPWHLSLGITRAEG